MAGRRADDDRHLRTREWQAVLETLKTYIDPPRGFRKLVLEQRPGLIALSVVCHVFFYATIILLDRWAFQELRDRSRRRVVSTELVKIADLGGGSDQKLTLRRAPEPIDRAPLNRLKLDSENSDDTRLITKSPRPGAQEAGTNEAKNRTAQAVSGTANPAQQKLPESRPVTVTTQGSPVPSQQANQLPMTVNAPPPRPMPEQPQAKPNNDSSERPRVAARNTGDPGELGLQREEGQYIAAVRTKIYKLNERMMPRDWVKTVLADKVSADFDIVLGRGGRLLEVKLRRSCGYPILDKVAREAIVTAAPFEGWPSEAADKLPFTVTMFYTPVR